MIEGMLSLPLRVEDDGLLAREKRPVESLVQLFRVMASTRSGTWPHAPWFGLEEVFAAANPRLLDQQAIAEAFNRALAELEVQWARVHSVTRRQVDQDREQATGERHFDLLLLLGGRLVPTALSVKVYGRSEAEG